MKKIIATIVATLAIIVGLGACGESPKQASTISAATPVKVVETTNAEIPDAYPTLSKADRFRGLLQDTDVNTNASDSTIDSLAEQICENLSVGVTKEQMTTMKSEYFTEQDLIYIVAASIVVYCPEQS